MTDRIAREADRRLARGRCGHGRACKCRKNFLPGPEGTVAYRRQTEELLKPMREAGERWRIWRERQA